uniref:MRG domain-containing protein n=1 Tax=Ditylenchus dipsaci TaxID=166011 RepID=A0A915DMC9_9BILA
MTTKMLSKKNPPKHAVRQDETDDDETGSESTYRDDIEDELDCNYEIGEKVMCLARDNLFYEAKIVDIIDYEDDSVYKVHYMGWNAKYDERLRKSELATRLQKFTQENKQKAEAELQKIKEKYEAMQALTAKPRIKKSIAKSSRQSKNSTSSSSSKRSNVASNRSSRDKNSCSRTESSRSRSKSHEVVEVPPVESLPLCIPFKQHAVKPISLDASLRWVLGEDRDYLLLKGMLPKIPAEVSVFEIIETYRVYVKSSTVSGEERKMPVIPNHLTEGNKCLSLMIYSLHSKEDLYTISLLDCFEHMARSADLLYEHEKSMHARLLDQLDNGEALSKKFTPNEQYKLAKVFGLPYLLRMLTQLHKLLAVDTRINQQEVDRLLYRCNGLVEFLTNNWKVCFRGASDYFLSPNYSSNRRAIKKS